MPQFRPLSETKFINDANLVSYWKLDGNSNDSKGSNNGTDTNITYGTNYGKYGQGALFNGSSSKIAIPSNASLDITGSITISAWVYIPSITGRMEVVSKSYTTSPSVEPYSFNINDNTGKISITCNDSSGNTNYRTSSSVISAGAWQHIVGVISNSTTIRLYINGQDAGSSAESVTRTFNGTNNQPLYIGVFRNANSWLNGSLDDIAIFNRALSASEVNELYQGMTLGEYLPNSNTKLLLHLNGSSIDSSGNGNNGTDTDITYSQANGRFGQGAGLNGSSSKIVLGNNLSSLKITNPFTIIGWFKSSAANVSQNIFSSFSYDGDFAGIRLFINTDNTLGGDSGRATGGGTSFKQIFSASTVNDDRRHCGIFVWDGSYLNLYVDGKASTPQSWSYAPAYKDTSYQRVGCSNNNGTDIQFFTGSLDEIIVLDNVIFTQPMVSKYYTYAKGRFGII